MHSSEIEKLINEISKLPGLGRRSAQRIALYLLKNKEQTLLPLVQSLQEANQKIINCETCGNIDTKSPCSLCQNVKRDFQTICVIEDVSDLWTFERMGLYKGVYHAPGQITAAIEWIATQRWAEIERISLLGFSVGAIVAPAVQHLLERRGTINIGWTVLAYGGADIGKIVNYNPCLLYTSDAPDE